MLLPANFKGVIASTFYDKTITPMVSSESEDDGWVTTSTTNGTPFVGNVRFSKLGELQAEIGLVDDIDIAVTCDTEVDIAVNDRFSYDSKEYVAVSVLPYDSHLMIVGRKWALK